METIYDDRFEILKILYPSWSTLEGGKGAKKGRDGKFYLPAGSNATKRMGVMGDDGDPNNPELKPGGKPNPKYEKESTVLTSRDPDSEYYLSPVDQVVSSGKSKASQAEIDDLAQEIVNSGMLVRPLVVTRPGVHTYKLVPGQEKAYQAAMKAQELNPRVGEMVSTVVVKDGKAAKRQLDLIDKHSKKQKAPNQIEEAMKLPAQRSAEYYLSPVDQISASIKKGKYPGKDVDALANEILKAGMLVRPVVVKATGPNQYKLVSGEFEYLAARRAQQLNPRAAEMVSTIVLTDNSAMGQISKL